MTAEGWISQPAAFQGKILPGEGDIKVFGGPSGVTGCQKVTQKGRRIRPPTFLLHFFFFQVAVPSAGPSACPPFDIVSSLLPSAWLPLLCGRLLTPLCSGQSRRSPKPKCQTRHLLVAPPRHHRPQDHHTILPVTAWSRRSTRSMTCWSETPLVLRSASLTCLFLPLFSLSLSLSQFLLSAFLFLLSSYSLLFSLILFWFLSRI